MKFVITILFILCVKFSFGQQIVLDSLLKVIDYKITNFESDKYYDETLNFQLENFPLENASLSASKKNKQLIKLVLNASNENAKQLNVYYFNNNELIFAKSAESNASEQQDNLTYLETKSYFVNEKLVHQIDSSDLITSYSQEYLLAAGESILDEVNALKLLLSTKDLGQN